MDIVTGDDAEIAVTLTKDGFVFTLTDSAVIKAAIIDKSNQRILAGPVTASRLDAGSDWANSLIVIMMPGRQTASIPTTMPAKLEIQVNDAGRQTSWFTNIMLIKGMIK